MATPTTEPPAEHERGQQRNHEEDEPRVDHALLSELHRFGGLDRRGGPAGDVPLNHVGDDQHLNDREHDRAALAGLGSADGSAWIMFVRQDVQTDVPACLHVGPGATRSP